MFCEGIISWNLTLSRLYIRRCVFYSINANFTFVIIVFKTMLKTLLIEAMNHKGKKAGLPQRGDFFSLYHPPLPGWFC